MRRPRKWYFVLVVTTAMNFGISKSVEKLEIWDYQATCITGVAPYTVVYVSLVELLLDMVFRYGLGRFSRTYF